MTNVDEQRPIERLILSFILIDYIHTKNLFCTYAIDFRRFKICFSEYFRQINTFLPLFTQK